MKYYRILWISLFVILSISILFFVVMYLYDDEGISLGVPSDKLLLPDTSLFPARWKIEGCDESCDREENAVFASRTFLVPGRSGKVIQEVYHFKSAHDAHAKFQLYREVEFRKAAIRTPSTDYVVPVDIIYVSTLADESYLACGIDSVSVCKLVVRYRNIFIFFYFVVDDEMSDGLTHAEIELIVNSLDRYIAPYLTATPTP